MQVEITKGVITQFYQGPKSGKFKTLEGQVYTFKLDLVQDASLRQELDSAWSSHLEIPITVGLYRSPSGMVVTHIKRSLQPAQSTSLASTVSPSLPAEPGPYRDAKEAYYAGLFKRAEDLFINAIREGDRVPSVVKDLAGMLNEHDRGHEAIVLINQFLLNKSIDKEERAKFVNLRYNIHNRIAKGPHRSSTAAFCEQIKGALARVAPAAPKEVPHLDSAPEDTRREFVCIVQEKKCYPLAIWTPEITALRLSLPSVSSFDHFKSWSVKLAYFSVRSDQQPIAGATGVKTEALPGYWVIPVALSDWQIEVKSPIALGVAETVYFRDNDILSGPWTVKDDGQFIATHQTYVYEWTWNEAWRRLDFPDRTYLLDTPCEREANFYDFAGPQQLAEWLQQKLAQVGPEISSQFRQLNEFCLSAFSSPLDLSRWERVRSLLGKTPIVSDEINPLVETPPTPPETDILHLATCACRCLLVPGPAHSQQYSKQLKDCHYFLLTPSVTWLNFRDAWHELEWVWNLAHSRPESHVLVHIEQADLTLLQHWAKPLLNIAHDLTPYLPGFSELSWPENLRLHWSTSLQADSFPLDLRLQPAFAGLRRDMAVFTGHPSCERTWESCTKPLAHLRVDTSLGDYARAAALEISTLQALGVESAIATEIRFKLPKTYWRCSDANQV